jgi:hypothetical protein
MQNRGRNRSANCGQKKGKWVGGSDPFPTSIASSLPVRRPRPSRLSSRGATTGRPFCPHRLHRGCVTLLGGAFSGRGMRLPRKRPVRSRRSWLTLQRAVDCPRPLRRGFGLGRGPVPAGIGSRCAFARPFARLALLWWRQIHAGPPRFRQADGYGLLGGPGPVLAFANVVNLLANKLAGLRGRRLAFALVLPRSLDGLFLWHDSLPFTRWTGQSREREVHTMCRSARGIYRAGSKGRGGGP